MNKVVSHTLYIENLSYKYELTYVSSNNFCSKTLVTYVTFKILFFGVKTKVLFQITFVRKVLSTNIASKFFLTTMYQHVPCQMTFVSKLLITDITFVRIFFQMNFLCTFRWDLVLKLFLQMPCKILEILLLLLFN